MEEECLFQKIPNSMKNEKISIFNLKKNIYNTIMIIITILYFVCIHYYTVIKPFLLSNLISFNCQVRIDNLSRVRI